MTKQNKKNKQTQRQLIGFILLGAFFVLVAILLFPYWRQLSDPAVRDRFVGRVHDLGIVGVLVFMALQFLQVVIAIIPGEVVEILAGVLYKTWGGYLICMVGCVASSALVFYLVRRFGSGLVEAFTSSEKLQRFTFLHNTKKLNTVIFLLFFIPGLPKDLLTYFVPMTKIKMSSFLLLTTIARIPSVLSSTYAGATLQKGNIVGAIIIFAIAGALGAVGILWQDKILGWFQKHKKSAKF